MARLDALFDNLIKSQGSDLHLGIGYPPMMRQRGDLVPLRDTPISSQEMEALLFEITSDTQRARFLEEMDLDFAYSFGDKARFRANYFVKQSGLAAVFRIIPSKIVSLEDLRCPPAIRRLAEKRGGLVLVTGPTGSGKSTTLAAMIHHINETRACHILTIEDPIEFVHESRKAQVTHREVGPHAATFASAIRSAGRENPDVILIGELRDNETMRLALQLASFGILVFGTVHTNSAASTIDRIVNAFPADEQAQVAGILAESLAGVVAQQLLKTSDGKSRVACHEILISSPAVGSIIRENRTFQIPNMLQAGGNQGMQTMDMALERLVQNGSVRPEDAYEKASDKESFQKVLQRLEAEARAKEQMDRVLAGEPVGSSENASPGAPVGKPHGAPPS
jgi:twitching motility protein PilT